MESSLELKLAHDGAMRCADVLKRLLTPAIFYAEAGFVYSREGTNGDTADHLAEDIAEARIYVKIDRNAVAASNTALTLANNRLAPQGTRAGLKVGKDNFCHAHEAIVETLASVALHFKAFSEDLDKPRFVDDETIDIQLLRENLADACESISHEPFFLTHEDIDLLVRDARQEFAEATTRVSSTPTVPIVGNAPVGFEDLQSWTLDDDKRLVVLNGEPFPLTAKGFVMMEALISADGAWVSGWADREISKPSEVKNGLPLKVRVNIETESGKGYRIKKSSAKQG